MRGFSSLQLDDNVNTFIEPVGIKIPSARLIDRMAMANRQGRIIRVKADVAPLEFEVPGRWIDGGGKYWRDFKASMLNQSGQPFNLGDGAEFRSCDVLEVPGSRAGGVFSGASGNAEMWMYSAKILSREPVARAIGPGVSAPVTLTTSNGVSPTTFTVPYAGSAYGEPTWQFTLVVQAGVTITSVALQNTTTGETCTCGGVLITNGTYYLLMDASGAVGAGLGNPASNPVSTPNNDSYGLLNITSNGYGCTLSGSGDVDFVGVIPTLQQSLAIPPVTVNNSLTATIVANGVVTSATLKYVNPARYWR